MTHTKERRGMDNLGSVVKLVSVTVGITDRSKKVASPARTVENCFGFDNCQSFRLQRYYIKKKACRKCSNSEYTYFTNYMPYTSMALCSCHVQIYCCKTNCTTDIKIHAHKLYLTLLVKFACNVSKTKHFKCTW